MKTFIYVVIAILLGAGILFVLVRGGQDQKTLTDQATKSQEEQKPVDKKTYSAPPATLPADQLAGRKAKFTTNQGTFIVSFYGDKAPKTVSNFITLAKDGFYDGLIFHRVIPDFMIQGGDPEGNGTGGPGYKFEDEVTNGLSFSKKGLIAMANSGPGTNGSQFFVTVSTPTYLDNKHTIFGEVTEGYDTVEKISKVERDSSDKPLKDVVMEKVEIL